MADLSNESGKCKKPAIYLALLCVVLLGTGIMYMLYPSEYQKKLADLESACAELTQNDPEGRVYNPIVGRYLGSKSKTMMVPSISGWLSHIMVFQDGAKEIIIYTGTNINVVKKYFTNIEMVLGKEAVHQQKDTEKKYGICVFKNNANNFVGKIETLTQIGM